MKILKNILKNKYLYIAFCVITTLLLLPTLVNILFFPKEINLLAGNTHKLNFNIPVVATVKADENNDININNEPLDDKTSLNLNNDIYLNSEKEGSHNMMLSVMGIPLKNVTVSVLPDMKLIPAGNSIGVRINTDGVMVLGIGPVLSKDGKEYEPAKNILKPGDMILKVNDIPIDSKETLMTCIEQNDMLNIEIRRDNNIENVNIRCIKGTDDKNKIGVWVRDSTQGIGTLTYINPNDASFGALGHGIVDVDTREIMKVKDGKLMQSDIIDIKKGEKGSPGELVGNIQNKNELGEIKENTSVGIYGTITNNKFIDISKAIPVGLKDTVQIGEASILCDIDGSVKEYSIEIESINKYNIDSSKSMVIKITDERLLSKTNGIIQGMSGSPIIQDGKLIGAVTHVFVNDPTKGYGIYIENMLNR